MDKTELENFILNGLSQRQIAKIKGCTQSTIGRWLRRYNITKSDTIKRKCIQCGQPINTGPAKFCSNTCCARYGFLSRMNSWLNGTHFPGIVAIRHYLEELRGHKCEVCNTSEWMGRPIPVEVEHKDGHSENDSPDNVILICPNCHAQTDTYKNKNKGNGRHSRRERYSKGLSY
jgi:hypothetical protein